MACGACNKDRAKKPSGADRYDLNAEYQYLTQQQLQARLEVFKRRYCADCVDRYVCDYAKYAVCEKRLGK